MNYTLIIIQFYYFIKSQQALNIIKSNLNHSYTTLSDNWRNEILFDSILDVAYFCLKKGFSLAECVKCCSILFKLIEQFKKSK